jgi:hypothetical protein
MAEPGTAMEPPVFSLQKDDLVTLCLGPEEKEFAVHESCITRNSEFFKAALKREWSEGQTRIINLPEETCIESFVNYLNFGYHEKLPTTGITMRVHGCFPGDPYGELSRIYVVGERMLDKTVQNAIVKEFARLATIESATGGRRYPGKECITRIYEGTTRESPMRRMMVDFYATHGNTKWPYKGQHPEFVEDLAEKLQEKIMTQKEVRDFRGRDLIAEDYFV